MGIAKGCKGFEVITFNKNMVWSLSVIAEDGTFRYFNKHRLVIKHSLFYILRFVFPNQTILFLRTKKLKQLRFLIICKTFQLIYLLCEFVFVHKDSYIILY